jgi:hypothetical protein
MPNIRLAAVSRLLTPVMIDCVPALTLRTAGPVWSSPLMSIRIAKSR